MGIRDLLSGESGETGEEFPGTDTEDGQDGIDPKPKRPKGQEGMRRPPAPKVTPQVRREIHEKLSAMIEFFALGWQLSDPVCGEVLEDQAADITDRMVTVICKRPRWVAWFTAGADYQDWLLLATALQPVIIAAWHHHVAHDRAGPGTGEDEDLARYAAPAAA
jgi:hypothetical protein